MGLYMKCLRTNQQGYIQIEGPLGGHVISDTPCLPHGNQRNQSLEFEWLVAVQHPIDSFSQSSG